jgi:hypothetical protein
VREPTFAAGCGQVLASPLKIALATGDFDREN